MYIKIAVLKTNPNRSLQREQFIAILLKYQIYILKIPYDVCKLARIFISMKRWNNRDSLHIEAYDKTGIEESLSDNRKTKLCDQCDVVHMHEFWSD